MIKHMKKYIVSSLLMLSIIIPVAVFAETEVDPNGPVSTCVSLQNNLRYQSRDANTNGEVSTFQDFLQSKGYLNSEPTGYFGILTTQASKAFQLANGIKGDGYVGPITRAMINAMSCNGESTTTTTTTTNFTPPATGCSKGAMFNSVTGQRCGGTTFRAGCTSTYGFSSTTGEPCGATKTYLPGCSSTSGWSTTTGISCGQTNLPEPKVYVTINNSGDPATVKEGESFYVKWTSENTFSCNATGSAWDRTQFSDVLVTSGYIPVRADNSAEYTISCKGYTKTVSDSIKVNVKDNDNEDDDSNSSDLEIKTSSTLPSAKIGKEYFVSLNVSGGNGSYHWSLDNNAAGFPATGLGFSQSDTQYPYSGNAILGTPATNTAGTYTFNVNVTSGSKTISKQFTLKVESSNDDSSFPKGCSSSSGWSTTTGQACNRDLIEGCKSFSGWSSITGISCEI